MFDRYVLNPLFEAVDKFALNSAFCINEKFYTYEEFATSISKIRAAIQKQEANIGNIGLVVNDDIETYASIFAIWLEGYAYVPIHPQQPRERSVEIISQADVHLLIDSTGNQGYNRIALIDSSILKDEEINLKYKQVPDDTLSYILFTSGSTGKPKGVQITRGNVGSFMKSFWDVGFIVNQNDKCLQCFDLTFDVSVQSFLVPLTRGACTFTIPHDRIKYSYVYGLLEDHQLTFGAMAPSMIRYLRPYFDEINIPSMRYNILTAEASPLSLIDEWAKCIPYAEIYDFYGPTEATIYCTFNKYNKLGANKQLNGMLSIGKPMNGLNAIIVDEKKQLLGENQRGELCISGDQITPGYWQNAEKNAECFFELKEGNTIKRYYKTGDSCYFDNDGDIMLAGRLDYQVKIQGYRVELGEIEYHAREFLSGQNTVAIAYPAQNENMEIALFVEGEFTDKERLIDYLIRKVPSYMIPSKIIVKDIFPLNANGKTDRILLKTFL